MRRKPAESLLCQSEAFRSKVENIERLNQEHARAGTRPEEWERTLCDGRSFASNTPLDRQLVSRQTVPVEGLKESSSTPFLQLLGRSKLREEFKWLGRSAYKHFYISDAKHK